MRRSRHRDDRTPSSDSAIQARIAKGTTVHADESGVWNDLHGRFEMKRINHEEAYSLDGACTNWAQEFFSRMRRAEIGHHHHIAGAYLLRYPRWCARWIVARLRGEYARLLYDTGDTRFHRCLPSLINKNYILSVSIFHYFLSNFGALESRLVSTPEGK
jgi:ISXO2-like transposase domain